MSPAKFNERLLSEPKIINIFVLKDVFIVAVAASECEYEGSKSRQTPDLNKSLWAPLLQVVGRLILTCTLLTVPLNVIQGILADKDLIHSL